MSEQRSVSGSEPHIIRKRLRDGIEPSPVIESSSRASRLDRGLVESNAIRAWLCRVR
jgi:hypothetical protein